MKRLVVAALLTAAGGCATVEDPALGTAESGLAVTFTGAVNLDVDTSGPAPTGWGMFHWTPDFSVNLPAFDSLNRAYMRDRTTFMDEIPGTVSRLRWGVWESPSFLSAVSGALPCEAASCRVCFDDAGGEYGSLIVFDKNDRAYTAVHAWRIDATKACPANPPPRTAALLLLRSSNFGTTWQATALPCARQFAIERPYSPEPLEGPPAILLNDTDTPSSPYCDTQGNNRLTLVTPTITGAGDGVMTIPPEIELQASGAINISSHSGGGTQVITYRGKVYAVWGSRAESGDESPVHVSVYDPASATLTPITAPEGMASRPRNDSHNRSALAIDTTERLHLMIGAHQCAFRYLVSTPLRAEEAPAFGTPSATLPYPHYDLCRTDPRPENPEETYVEQPGQTYVSMVRDRFDTLHLVYRLFLPSESGYPEGYYLAYQRKPAGGAWSTARVLVRPPHSAYSVYYQQLAIDHRGWLYVPFSWFTDKNCDGPDVNPQDGRSDVCEPPGNWFGYAQLFKYSSLLVSRDGGTSWQLASTQTFDDATFWAPASGTAADVDGNGLDDVVHVYWDHGLELHLDGSYASNGVWQGWTTRGRRQTDGDKVLERPVLSGDVDGDTREDLVFVYRETDLKIRTKLARTDGGFDTTTASDGSFVPDSTYPVLMGDVTGEGRADLVMPYWSNNCLNIRTKVRNADGTWTTNVATCVALARMSQYPVEIGRIDAGTKSDLVFLWRDTSGFLWSRVLLAGTSAGGQVSWTATTPQKHTDGSGIHQYPHLLGDVNGDGYDDLVFLFRHWSTGNFSVRVKFALGNGYGWSGSHETQHPDGSQVPHYTPLIGKVNGDDCADILLPHRLGSARDGDYQIRTFLAVCDKSTNAQWSRTTARLP